MRRLKSFFTFDLPVNYKYLYIRFRQTHERQRYLYSSWPAEATRRKLISDYWSNVLFHYLLLFSLSTLFVSLSSIVYTSFEGIYFPTLIMLGVFTYLPLYFMIYRPTFNREFLPNLETVIAEYEGGQQLWMEKCKKDQPTVRALAFFFYVLDKTGKINYLSDSDKCADHLHKIFGVSTKAMKTELDLIFKDIIFKKDKRPKLKSRHLTQIEKSFEEAYSLLEGMQFTEGIQHLRELEQRFKRL